MGIVAGVAVVGFELAVGANAGETVGEMGVSEFLDVDFVGRGGVAPSVGGPAGVVAKVDGVAVGFAVVAGEGRVGDVRKGGWGGGGGVGRDGGGGCGVAFSGLAAFAADCGRCIDGCIDEASNNEFKFVETGPLYNNARMWVIYLVFK